MKIKKLLTTRFDDSTWNENTAYRASHSSIQCVYGSPQMISHRVDIRSLVCVIEMNNSTNQIMGIGLIKNEPQPRYEYIPYKCGNYNRYVFTGNYRLDRDELPSSLTEIIDYILFKEKTHMKRGSGFTTIPEKLLYHRKCEGIDIIQEITRLFVTKYKRVIVEEKNVEE